MSFAGGTTGEYNHGILFGPQEGKRLNALVNPGQQDRGAWSGWSPLLCVFAFMRNYRSYSWVLKNSQSPIGI